MPPRIVQGESNQNFEISAGANGHVVHCMAIIIVVVERKEVQYTLKLHKGKKGRK